MKTMRLCVVTLVALLAFGSATQVFAQDQLILSDGIANSFFFGGGSTHITLTMPTFNCSGGTCVLAQSTATGTGDLAGSGNYLITAPGTIPVPGGFAGPFSLTVLPDGSSVVS